MGGDVHLRSDSGQQSRLENWIEFQNYHLHTHEGLEKERDDLKEELDVARKKVEGADAVDLECAAENVDCQQMLEAAERQLGQHKNLLQCIEQERMVMDAVHPPSVEGDHDDQDGAPKAVRKASAPDRRKRRSKARLVLSLAQAGAFKPEPRKRNMQRQKRKEQEAEPATMEMQAPAVPATVTVCAYGCQDAQWTGVTEIGEVGVHR